MDQPTQLIQTLVQSEDISKKELAEIKDLIDNIKD